ncbi:uncharacterized protein L201_001248 [Kwoniella dendrophila CBS 6074]|uniref:Uncharacterized protein n=1 Tax=Kwoniella dendrophila CBS 6074 TaxID=1295534 RepID=A0AAX4JLU4_9TREE
MALRDSNLYTLALTQSKADPAITELIESGSGIVKNEARYAKLQEYRQGEAYSAAVYDVLSGAKLASMGFELEKAKKRRLQLHGPDEDIPFEYTGRINFEWTFEFEGNRYRWTREVYGKDYICSIDRKPDPRVEICLARDSTSKGPGRIQILHYNIDRFTAEIQDLRGLETLLVASLLCLLDAADSRNAPSRSTSGSNKLVKNCSSKEKDVAPIPARPERVISDEDFEPENPNEIFVTTTSDIDNHIARAINLLQDPHVLFIVIKTKTANAAQRALEVSLGITRFRHRESLADLHQYVVEEPTSQPTPSPGGAKTGPRIIKLDDEPQPTSSSLSSAVNGNSGWIPPPNISIYLSTIELPDLKPGRREHLQDSSRNDPKDKPLHVPSLTPPTLPIQNTALATPPQSKRSSSFGKLFSR